MERSWNIGGRRARGRGRYVGGRFSNSSLSNAHASHSSSSTAHSPTMPTTFIPTPEIPPPPPPPPPLPLHARSSSESSRPPSNEARGSHSVGESDIGGGSSSRHSGYPPFPCAGDGRIILKPAENGYDPSPPGSNAITTAITAKYDFPYTSWAKIPKIVRDMWFAQWKIYVTWDDHHENHMRNAFEYVGNSHMRSMLYNIRHAGQKPIWMSQQIYEGLLQHWASPDFKKRSEQAKKNRASDIGGSLHCGGSVATVTHASRMSYEAGREVTPFEVFRRMHTRRSDNTWVEDGARKSAENFQELVTRSQAQNPGKVNEAQLWSEVVGGRNKKGRFYGMPQGLGCSTSANLNSTAPPPEYFTEIKDLRVEFREMKTIMNNLVEMFTRSHATPPAYPSRPHGQSSTQGEQNTSLQDPIHGPRDDDEYYDDADYV